MVDGLVPKAHRRALLRGIAGRRHSHLGGSVIPVHSDLHFEGNSLTRYDALSDPAVSRLPRNVLDRALT